MVPNMNSTAKEDEEEEHDESPSEVMEMVRCNDCQHLVPSTNLVLHQATACSARARRRRRQQQQQLESSAQTMTSTSLVPTAPTEEETEEEEEDEDHASDQQQRQQDNRKRERHDNHDDDDDVDHDRHETVIDLSNANTPSPQQQQSRNPRHHDDHDDNVPIADEWPCPRCTLLNSWQECTCAACGYKRNNNGQEGERQRPADATRRERLVNEHYSSFQSMPYPSPPHITTTSTTSTTSYVSGGAILGGILGAAGAYLRGDTSGMGSAVLNGAMSGAMGGAVLDTVMQNNHASSSSSPPQQEQQEQVHPAATVYARSPSPPPSGVRTTVHSHRMSPHASIVYGYSVGTPDGRVMTLQPGDPLLALLMASPTAHAYHPHYNGGPDIDAMSYEQLLQAFGHGNDHFGASPTTIASLPTSTIQQQQQLQGEHKDCSICLESFKLGDTRKALPCLHGFHTHCIDKWLRSNGSCPICKHIV